MNFASPFVYEYDHIDDDDIYEVVSDEEFDDGMHLSDSAGSSSSEDEEEEELEVVGASPPPPSQAPPPAPEAQPGGTVSDSDAAKAEAKPSILNRLIGSISSAASRKSAAHTQSLSAPQPRSSGRRQRSRPKVSKPHHWKSPSDLKFSSSKSSSKGRKFRRADTNIVSLRFDTLKKPSTMHAGEVIQCGGCEAIMSVISCLEVDGPDKVWKCEFCEHRNLVDIEEEEKPSADDVTYLVEAALSTAASGTLGRDESIVIFCVDISGSMTITTEVPGHKKLRGSATLRRLRRENTIEGPQFLPNEGHNVTYISRLQAVQAAVDHQLEEMAKDFPHRRIALVTFSNDVTVIGDGTGETVTVSGQKLTNKEELMKVGSELPMPRAIKEVKESLSQKLYGLEEGGSTALGPAIVVALGLASRHPGSKVILCTDGKSNEGVGKVENMHDSDPSPDEFYQDIANTANSKGVSVSVVTISGTDCKLIQLGILADNTGGQVNIVDPLKLTEEFRNVLADRIIATSVVATFIVHKHLYIGKNETDACKEKREIGTVNLDHEISFEFGVRRRRKEEPKNPQPIPLDCISEVSTSLEVSSISPPTASGDGVNNNSSNSGGGGGGAETTVAPPPAAEGGDTTASETQSGTSGGGSEGGACAGGSGGDNKGGDAPEDIPSELPFQVQITYTNVDGTKALRVLTQKKPVTKDRHVAEREVDLHVLGMHTERRTSELALQGDYSGSRGLALMNQRLGWRTSHNSSDDSKRQLYHQMFSRVQTVENSVSRAQMKERLTYGRTHSDDDDEEAEDSKELMDSTTMARDRASCMAHIPQRPRLNKKMKLRSEEVDDGMANILFKSHNASPSAASKTNPAAQNKDQKTPKKTGTSDG